MLPSRPELGVAIGDQKLKIVGTDSFLVGFDDFFIVDNSVPGNFLGVFSAVKSNKNLGYLTVKAFGRDHFTVLGMLNTSKIILIFNLRKAVEHLDDRVEVA